MRRRALPSLIALLAAISLALPAHAASWCRQDPIVNLEGNRVQILVAVPAEYVHAVNGPIRTYIDTPRRVDEKLLYTDAGFNGHGEEVIFGRRNGKMKRGKFTTDFEVEVPVDESSLPQGFRVPVRVEIIPEHGAMVTSVGTHRSVAVSMRLRKD